ncbi:PadR family transcriptional regulator [Kordiimonas marina]|uniref:PadR family transcriptional regulator n=1 Tax=Kordiimonas marina TaxID=2872312 RepID=UPI001FF3B278|nr:PadR family transcriptional regulator [Kordiimonas marina]MCJ9429010.1 PadR family transcriptional regulator [Kordiimonas marina]
MDIRTLCLGILSLGEATGYEIRKMVTDGSFSFFSEASYGSIYPALTQMTADGLVACRAESQTGRPDKKVYSLTADGRKALEQSLTAAPGPDRHRSDFLAALLFAEAVSPDRINALIHDRISEHDEQIALLKGHLKDEQGTVARFVLEYGLVMQEAARRFLKENRARLSPAPEKQTG